MNKAEVYINILVENGNFNAAVKGSRLGIESCLSALITHLSKTWNISEKQLIKSISQNIMYNAMAKEVLNEIEKSGGLDALLEELKNDVQSMQ